MSAALPARPATAPSWIWHLMVVAPLTIGLALVFPYLLIQLAGGALVRLVYPGYVALLNFRWVIQQLG
jgi:hypothetical protein